MLARERSDLRAWAVFAVLALIPALLFGAVGYRAVRGEEAASARAFESELDVAKERIENSLRAAIAGSNPESAVPSIAEPLVLEGTKAASSVPPECEELAAELARSTPEARAEHERRLFGVCVDAPSASGFYLAPLVAASKPARPADFDLAGFVEARALKMKVGERRALASAIGAIVWLSPAEKARIEAALTAQATSLEPVGRDAIRNARPDPGGLVRYAQGGVLAVVRVEANGVRRGYVVHHDSLRAALEACGQPSPAKCAFGDDVRKELPVGIELRVAAAEAKRSIVLAPELVVQVDAPDSFRAARATKARLVWGTLSGVSLVLALALFAVLYRRALRATRTSELRTDFVAAVSHELRTPAASIRMLAELLRDGKIAPEEVASIGDTLAAEATRLGDTVERLLRFRSLDGGKTPLVEADLGAVARSAVDTFVARHPGARITTSFGRHPARLDPDAIRLAIDNLLANAWKYALQGPTSAPYEVTIRAARDGWALTVKDHGPGIPAEAQRRIFLPFERAGDKLSEAVSGFGIGLALVRSVARAHGGDVSLESTLGEGAAFTITIPRNEEEA